MKVNIVRRIVNGRGTMSSMKSAISATSRRKTYEPDVRRGCSRKIEVMSGLDINAVASFGSDVSTYETVIERHLGGAIGICRWRGLFLFVSCRRGSLS